MKILNKEIIKSTVFIHYGNYDFELSRVKPIKKFNNHYNKPKIGGLWFSPKDSNYSWENWCKQVNFPMRSEYIWECNLLETAKIVNIEKITDIFRLPTKILEIPSLGAVCKYVNYWELIKLGYDGIFLSESIVKKFDFIGYPTNNKFCPTFRYWDCESLLLFSPDCIKKIVSYKQ